MREPFKAQVPTKIFFIESSNATIAPPKPKVFARYVPERDDDFAWENDRIAFRMYGKNLEPRLVSSGVDVWTKRVRESIINLWFKGGDKFYHTDNGTGLDMYSVKKSRGCGGSGVWDGKTLHVSRNYKDWKIIANGGLRTIFELTYETWNAGGVKVREVKRITLDAGENLNRIESFYQVVEGKPDDVNIVVGIARHEAEWKGEFDADVKRGWMSRWEATGENGSLGCGVVAAKPAAIIGMHDETGVDTATEHPNHLMILQTEAVDKSKPRVAYYAGGGWDKSGDFKDKKAWNDYLANFAARINSPLKISYLTALDNDKNAAARKSSKGLSNVIADSLLATYPDPKNFGSNPRWHYDNGYFLIGLYDLGGRDGNRKYKDYVKGWVDLYVKPDGSIDDKTLHAGEYELDSMLPGRLLIRLHRDTGDARYKRAAYQVMKQLETQPRTGDGGYWHKKVYTNQMWLDGLYMAGPLSVEFARTFNEPRYYTEAAKQMELMYEHTRDAKTGLMFHGWKAQSRSYWTQATWTRRAKVIKA